LVTTGVSVFLSGRDVWLTDKGRAQVHHLVGQVRPRRVAAVYSSRIGTAVESAELASELGLASVVVDGLQDFPAGDLETASLHDERWSAVAIGEIVDVHRGETLLVFSHGGAVSPAILRLSVNVGNNLAGQGFLPNCAVAEVELDADGWRLVSWPGASEQA
jgi:broad specificity phosphatase PhoE